MMFACSVHFPLRSRLSPCWRFASWHRFPALPRKPMVRPRRLRPRDSAGTRSMELRQVLPRSVRTARLQIRTRYFPAPGPDQLPVRTATFTTRITMDMDMARVTGLKCPMAVDLASTPDKNEDQNQDNAQEPEDDEAGYQGGPTIFDRRGLGASSYVPPVTDMPRPHEASQYADPADDTPQAQTVLVFKNRQQLEVSNYAIQGGTLFDLTPGHSRRIALADLDLAATQLQNENRGVVFALPVAPAN